MMPRNLGLAHVRGSHMLTRRDLLLGFAITILPAKRHGIQRDKPQPGKDELTTVTLTIDGMT